MKRCIILGLVVFCLCSSAVAQKSDTTLPRKWTLRECIDHAIENNIEIKSIEISLRESELELNTNRNSRLPNLSASLGQSFSFGQSPVRRMDDQSETWVEAYENTQTANSSFSLSASVPVFSGMRIKNSIKASEFDLKAATENLRKARENLELEVASLYLEGLFKKEITKVHDDALNLTRSKTELTEQLVESGKAPRSQLYDILAELARNETNLITANNELELALLNLAQALNIPDPDNFDIVEPDLESGTVDESSLGYSPNEIFDMAVDIKPHITEALMRLESSRMGLKVTKADFWPSISFGLGYSNSYYYAFGGEGNQSFGEQIRNQGNEGINLSMSIPIFNKFATRNRVRAARLSVDRRQLDLENIKLAVYKEIRQAYQGAIAAKATYASSQRAFEAAQEAYNYARERYAVGKMTVYEMSEAQSQLTASSSDRLQAKYRYVFQMKILDFYRGLKIDLDY